MLQHVVAMNIYLFIYLFIATVDFKRLTVVQFSHKNMQAEWYNKHNSNNNKQTITLGPSFQPCSACEMIHCCAQGVPLAAPLFVTTGAQAAGP